MKNKHLGKIIFFYVILFMSCFGETVEILLRYNYNHDYATAYGFLLTISYICIVSMIMMFVPFMCNILKKKPVSYITGKRICLWNSIILFIVSALCMGAFNAGFIGGIGSLFFYFINKWLFIDPISLPKEESLKKENKETSSTQVCVSWEDENPHPYGLSDGPMCEMRFDKDNDSYLKTPTTNHPYTKEKQLTEKVSKKPKTESLKEKLSNLSNCSIISVVLFELSIFSIIVAMNVQDADRNIFEAINPTVLYFVLIGINIACCAVLLFLKKCSMLKNVIMFAPAIFAVFALLEGSLFSKTYGYYNSYSYINNNLVSIFNTIWVSISFLLFSINLILLCAELRSTWHRSAKYREKCYKRVARIKEYLNQGIITQEEFEKNKKDILKNITF